MMLAPFQCCCGPTEEEGSLNFDIVDERVGSTTNTAATSAYFPEDLSPCSTAIAHEQGMGTLLRRPPMMSTEKVKSSAASTSTTSSTKTSGGLANTTTTATASIPAPALPMKAHFSPLEPAEDSKGREELLFSQFRQQASVGRSCVVLVQDAADAFRPASRRLANYSITADRELFVNFGPGHEPFSCSVDNIQDVYQLMDGEDCFPRNIIAALNKQELNQLLMVVFYPHGPRGTEDVRETFCFLETTPTGRDLLLELLKEVALAQ
eukprot:CAMPEP_0206469224 /NCGR_PEP_ID=MMETSP0324_2-20121206/30143_1 /ASSEMBLY_ACC=CAM_ASM_000836 /TAXON_ID=2866 /ORGANISM="Crypthecodinium cohnii, Strain Seligo" /LENGTH=264 /DNA_ID=CAMNT_0053942923 /DNA_START=152 /DNA_END=946 /DNA_ORIENTATION=+